MYFLTDNAFHLAVLLIVLLFAFIPAPGAASENTEDKASGPIIGIDLGTTYSCVGVYKNGKVDIIANDQGNRITPSYVAFTENGERLVGDAAKNQATTNPERTIFDVKRFIGLKYSESSVQADKKLVPYKLTSDKHDKPMIEVTYGNKTHTDSTGLSRPGGYRRRDYCSCVLHRCSTPGDQGCGDHCWTERASGHQ